jgi:hypothetical protein
MTKDEFLLVQAEASLKWAAEGEFSARITPEQARALLADRETARATIETQNAAIERLRGTAPVARARLGAHHLGDGIGAPPDFGRSSA